MNVKNCLLMIGYKKNEAPHSNSNLSKMTISYSLSLFFLSFSLPSALFSPPFYAIVPSPYMGSSWLWRSKITPLHIAPISLVELIHFFSLLIFNFWFFCHPQSFFGPGVISEILTKSLNFQKKFNSVHLSTTFREGRR